MNEHICRLCLQTITNTNCQVVKQSLLKSLKLNLKISKENVMCIECADSLQVFSNFTVGSVCMQDGTWSFSNFENGAQLIPEPIETTSNPKSLMETKIKCSFCTKTRGREDLISLQVSKENRFLLEQYVFETNLKNIEEFLTCDTCLEALEGILSVILKCLEVEEKISKYIELKGTNDKGQVELKEVQQFTFRPILKLKSQSFSVNKLVGRCGELQEEYTTVDDTEKTDEKRTSNRDLIIKVEDDSTSEQTDCDSSDTKSERSDCDEFQEPFNKNRTPNDPLHTSVVISDTRKSKDGIKQHLSTQKYPEIETFKCELCSFEAKRKCQLKRHLLTHKKPLKITTFKCDMCLYVTKHKYRLKEHLLMHKDPSEIKMFKCELCTFETKNKNYLKNHLLTHKSPSEIEMFKCKLCSYEAKRKCQLKRHLLAHKGLLEIERFKCALCSYEAKQKVHLISHLLTHKTPSEINMFKCSLCPHQTKQKSHLKTHLLTHKDPSEIKMFKCELCPYEGKQRIHLIRHMLTHKSPSEIKMFKCELCPYKAKLKFNLKQHLLVHKSPSELKMFKCELCSYEAKQKHCLKQHLLIHKSHSEIKMFKCEMCLYETKRKCHLKNYLTTHKKKIKTFNMKQNRKNT